MWIWIARICLAPLVAYEVLNAVGILHQQLTFTWWGLVVTSIPVWVALEVSHSYFKAKKQSFPWWVVIPVILAVYFDAGGDIIGMYNKFLWWDQVAHAVGSMATTVWIGAVFFPLWKADRLSVKARFLFLVAAGVLIGVVYELAEYLEDVISASNRLGDGPDTGNDLLWDLFGAVLVAAILPKLKIKPHHDRRSHSKTPRNKKA